jgi:branched-chain amino acid transport system substrate-binding protein
MNCVARPSNATAQSFALRLLRSLIFPAWLAAPPYYMTDLKTVALYRRTLLKYAPTAKPNFVSLEGFVDAMVLVEGLKKVGKEPTREGLIRALESLHDWDAGLGPDLRLEYSAKDHKGFHHVMPTVVRSGRAVPFTDWSIVPAN